MDIRSLTKNAVLDICTWQYDGDYACYNEDSYESKVKRHADILNPQKKDDYLCFYNQNILAAYVHLVKKDDSVFLGIAVRPELCNQGYGTEALRLTITIAKKKYPDVSLKLMVRSWNKRAIRCYQKAGFTIIEEKEMVTPVGPGHFIIMENKASVG